MKKIIYSVFAVLASFLSTQAMAETPDSISVLSKEIHSMKTDYESRINQLENKIINLQKDKKLASANSVPAVGRANSGAAAFNPEIGIILNGRFADFSRDSSNFAGFGVGEEGTRGQEGFGLGESEINFSANADDKFSGKLTASIVNEDGEDGIELEEAYVQTLPGAGLPRGLTVKAGRSLWNFGYINEHHAHSDDFADRPLPYRAYLNNAFNDDGVQISYILPTDFYSEIGGGAYRGEAFPAGSATGKNAGSRSAYARIGGDLSENQTWRLGASWLGSDVKSRLTNDDKLNYVGKDNLFAADLRYSFAPTGNINEKEIIFQSEYFWRNENGSYEDSDLGTGTVDYKGHDKGWYAQGIYKFLPQWRVGARYSSLSSPNVSAGLVGSSLDAQGYNPKSYTIMTDWTNSEFSRIRLQLNREELSKGNGDNQIMLQYVVSLGAHGAHRY